MNSLIIENVACIRHEKIIIEATILEFCLSIIRKQRVLIIKKVIPISYCLK